MTYTDPAGVWTLNQLVTHTDLNLYLRDNLDHLHNQFDANCLVYRSVSQSINNSSTTVVSWLATLINRGTMWSSVTPTRIVAPYTGRYRLWGVMEFANSTAGERRVQFRVNGGAAQELVSLHANFGTQILAANFAVDVALSADDYVELLVRQDSGGALDLIGSSGSTFKTRAGLRCLGE